MTQREMALRGIVSAQMESAAASDNVPVDQIVSGLAEGSVALPANQRHHSLTRVAAVGRGLRTKVNANIGASEAHMEIESELKKLRRAIDAGADTVMDLSTGPLESITKIRRAILENCPVPLGTVPIYEAAIEAIERRGGIVHMTVEDLFNTITRQAQDGVDFMTIHAGVTMEAIELMKAQGRAVDIVSRGGAFIVAWMLHNEQENPFYQHFDKLLEIAREFDVTLSLGDGLRPGSIVDATDRAQIQELITLGHLTKRAWDAGVQVIIEGPGHVPIQDIATNVMIQKRLCNNAPFYVLGPLVTDIAPGYDHITAAIGGSIAAMAGADFLCYVTPAEHLGLPSEEDVRMGIIAARIAAHAADIAKGIPGAIDWDRKMSLARKALDWKTQTELAIDPETATQGRKTRNPAPIKECTMCGSYCAMKIVSECLGSCAAVC